MKKILIAMAAAIVLIIFFGLYVPPHGHDLFICRLNNVRQDLQEGVKLQVFSDEFFQLRQRRPTAAELSHFVEITEMLTDVWDDFPRGARDNRTNVFSSLTGTGGWVYDTNTGTVAINLTNKIKLDDTFEFVPSQIKFTPLPVYPGLDAYPQSGMRQCLENLPHEVEYWRSKFRDQISQER